MLVGKQDLSAAGRPRVVDLNLTLLDVAFHV